MKPAIVRCPDCNTLEGGRHADSCLYLGKRVPKCRLCDDRGTTDYAGFAMDPCPECHPASVKPTAPETTKPTNPKDAIGSDKLPIHLWPTTATLLGSLALLDGASKYGRSNFREIGVRASIYYDAAMRHLQAWFEAEDNDPDSGVPHLGHALACLAILVDSQAAGKLNDDRMIPGGYRKLVTELTPHVARIKAMHAARSPQHYTIQDAKE